jgi:hypothetical protein
MAFTLNVESSHYINKGEFSSAQRHVLVNTSDLESELEQMPFVEDLVVKAPYTLETLNTLQHVLNNSATTSLKIQPPLKLIQKLTSELALALANILRNNKQLNKFILQDSSPSSIEDIQEMEILADGINRSSLKFIGFLNLPEFAINALFDLLSNNTTLEQLSLMTLPKLGWRLDRLVLNSNITKLHINSCALTDNDLSNLINILQKTTKLETLELRFVSLTFFKSFSDLCLSGIAENGTLTTLIIDTNDLSNNFNTEMLISAVKSHPTIKSLAVAGLLSKQIKLIAENFLENSARLTSLSINYGRKKNRLGPMLDPGLTQEEVEILSNMLATNTKLQHLYFGNIDIDHISDDCSMTFINALKSNTTLLTLDLPSDCKLITADGMIDYLLQNNTLKTLVMHQLLVTNAKKFFDAVLQNKSLTSLDISSLRHRTIDDIINQDSLFDDFVRNITTLKELKFNSIYQPFPPSLKYNESLTSVEKYHGTLSSANTKIYADVFSVNKTLLSCKSNLPDKQYIEPFLQRNRKYRLDAVILLLNIVRMETALLPNELWYLIFRNIGIFSSAMEAVFSF